MKKHLLSNKQNIRITVPCNSWSFRDDSYLQLRTVNNKSSQNFFWIEWKEFKFEALHSPTHTHIYSYNIYTYVYIPVKIFIEQLLLSMLSVRAISINILTMTFCNKAYVFLDTRSLNSHEYTVDTIYNIYRLCLLTMCILDNLIYLESITLFR